MKKIIPTNARDWSLFEVLELINLYQSFLDNQLRGEKYQKAAAVRLYMASLNRTRGSIEAKLMNVSAVLAALGMPACIVKGYKPLPNFAVDMIDPVKSAFSKYLKKAA